MPSSVTPAIRWSSVFFFLYLTSQLAFPIYRLFQPRPARFSWQMFSAASVPSRVWIKSGNRLQQISPASFIGYFRADLEWERYALPYLCRVHSEATEIRYLMPLETAFREYRC